VKALAFLGACLLSASALAQALPPLPAPPVERGHLSLTAGVGLRRHALTDAAQASFTVAGAPSPTALRLDGAWYFTRALGVRLEAAADLFVAQPDAASKALGAQPTLVPAVDVRAAAALRWAPRRWFSLEGQLGYALATQAFPHGLGPAVGALIHGPSLGLQLGTTVDRFTALAFLHAAPLGFFSAPDGRPLGMLGTLGLTVAVDVYRAPGLQLALALDYRLRGLQPYGQGAASYTASTHQLGLGLRVVLPGPEPVAPVEPSRGGLRVVGLVRFKDGRPAAGAQVALAGQALTTTEEGRFEAAAPSGPLEVEAALAGYRTVKQPVTVLAQVATEVTLVLVANSGPGALTVTVRSAEKVALADAEVALEGAAAGRTDAQGRLRLPKAGPGPVRVTAKAKGFALGDELVQVPPEGEAELSFALAKQGERALATLRGLIRSATGKPIKASVKVSGLDVKVQVKADGRFVVQVPGGTFSLTISAPGHVTQVKSVEVADGDQALFHADLQPVGR
jgi:hypothetical protein